MVRDELRGFREYLELHSYFARGGEPRLSRDEFLTLDAELAELVANLAGLTAEQRARLNELKRRLFRDKP